MDNELLKNDILSNLLTKCSNCKLKAYCEIHRDKAIEIKNAMDKFKKKTFERSKEHPNNIEWDRKLTKIVKTNDMKLANEFDEYLADRTCDYEKQEVVSDLEKLQKQYDFKDARVYLLVKQYLRQIILDFRAYKESARNNMITYRTTEDGSRIPMINPMLHYKLQSGNFITKLINDLDRITKEDKMIDSIETNNSRLFTNYLSNISNANYKEIKVLKKDNEDTSS